METGKRIIVPWDFTDVAQNALAHAAKLARALDNTITLLHISDEKSSDTQLEKLQKVAADATASMGIQVDAVVRPGSIFTTIGDYTKENEDINFVVMGTHGMKGMQKLTGSWALKVIVSSEAPFIVVQDQPTEKVTYDKIVFPIDFKNENREKLIWAIYFGKMFNAKIYFIAQSASGDLANRIKTNLLYARRYLDKYGVEYEIADNKTGKISESTIEYAKEIDADLMLIMTTKNIGALDYVLGADEQYIIANTARIPVMCVNPRKPKEYSLAKS